MTDRITAHLLSQETKPTYHKDLETDPIVTVLQGDSRSSSANRRTGRKARDWRKHIIEQEQEDIITKAPQRSAVSASNASSPSHSTFNHATALTSVERSVRRKVGLEAYKPDTVIHQRRSDSLLRILPIKEQSMNPARLFIASLGNPPPYSTTRHSAGHLMIKTLQSYLQFPAFQKSRTYANGLTSMGADVGRPEFVLWQSPSLMNVSGAALLKAYKAFVSTTQNSPADSLPGLIILYDEMETNPSQLRLRRGTTSPKGHNGLKSVQQQLQSGGLMSKLGDRYVKIGVGIGRPAGGSRTSEDVSQYVLGQFTGGEKQALDAKVEDLVNILEAEAARMST